MSLSDMSQYLGVFLDEGREQLGLLEANILKMECGDHSTEMLQILFRAAHTLKGSSRAMGFLEIGALTHEMENILDALRTQKLSVSTPIVDVLLDCLDALNALIESVAAVGADTQASGKDIPALVARLDLLRNGAQSTDGPPPPQETLSDEAMPISEFQLTALQEAQSAGLNIFRIQIVLSPECLMKSVRVFMVLGALEPLGSVLVSWPGEEYLEEEKFDLKFDLLFASDRQQEQITDILETVSEVDSITVSLWEPCAPAHEAMPAIPAVAVSDEAADAPAAAVNSPAAHSQTIRVDIARLDNLLNLIGEMVIDRTQVARIGENLHDRYSQDELVGQLIEATGRIARITSELQEEIMKTRMLPIDGVFQRMPRMVRDLAQKTGKEVKFEMHGGETELDRSVLEILGDPLIHLLRNSVDHGIEAPEERLAAGKPREGSVTLSARHEENYIVIEIVDDGRGMDPVKLKAAAVKKGIITQSVADQMTDRDSLSLIFASGFSTAATLTDISGRGVGMDIVKSNLEKLGGRILIDSRIGAGAKFTVSLPLTLAIVRALLVSSGGGNYVMPLGSIVEMLRLGKGDGAAAPKTIGGQAVIVLRGRTIPLINLADALCGDPRAILPESIAENAYVVIIGYAERQIGICVDNLIGEQEVVIKSLGILLGDIPGLSGATILGDGRVALIVDAAKAVACVGDSTRLIHREDQ